MDKELEKTLKELEDPNYKGGSWALSPNASPLEKSKYKICQSVIRYKRENKLTTEKVAQQIQLSLAETDDILHCHITYFTLDRLVDYASRLFEPLEIDITKAEKRTELTKN